MNYGICKLSIVPVRKQPSEKSEMVNQLLFGDLITIYESDDNWTLIRTNHDMYEGWVDTKQIVIIDEDEFIRIKNSNQYFMSGISGTCNTLKHTISIVHGSMIPNYSNGNFYIVDEKYNIDSGLVSGLLPANDLLKTALKYLEAPYLWGGRSPFGIDCSGFVQIVFGIHGISMGRDAYQQAETGLTIDFINEAVSGDLAFFDNEEEKITHVGIMIDNKKILHASGKVRIDNIDHQGIYNEELKKYTHKLRIIKRVIS